MSLKPYDSTQLLRMRNRLRSRPSHVEYAPIRDLFFRRQTPKSSIANAIATPGMAGYVCHNCGRFVPALQGLGSRIFRRYLPLSAHPPHIQLTRKEIIHFPNLTYPGKVVIITHPSLEERFEGVINEFAGNKVLGFDTESKPTFQKYQKLYGPCLIQLASRDLCIMWRLRGGAVTSETFPPMLRAILRARDITKVCCVCLQSPILIVGQNAVNFDP